MQIAAGALLALLLAAMLLLMAGIAGFNADGVSYYGDNPGNVTLDWEGDDW